MVFCLDLLCVYESGFEEGGVGTVFLDSAEATGGDFDGYSSVELRHEYSLLLKVDMLALLTSRIKLGRTSTVGVSSADN